MDHTSALRRLARAVRRNFGGRQTVSPSSGGNAGLRGARFIHDGSADEVAPLGPGAVIVANLVEAEQILEREPRVRAALTDAAVGDDFARTADALIAIELLQIVEGLESAVLVSGLRPGNIGGLGNMAGALRGFAHPRRRDDFAGELINGTNVDELAGLLAVEDRGDVFLESADGFVGGRNAIGGGGDAGEVLGECALFLEPFLAAAVDEANILVAVELELPERIGREPVVIVTVKNDARVIGDAGIAEKLFESGPVDQIAANAVLELGLPVPSDSARDVALVVCSRVHVHFDEARARRIEILCGPIRGNQYFGMFVL